MGKDDSIQVRIDGEKKKFFIEKCESMGRNHADVLRELIDAFGEGRLKITPTTGQKKAMEEYYD